MKFASIPIIAAAAGSVSAAGSYSNSTSTSWSTSDVIQKTTLTVTSCGELDCTEVPVVTGLTTVTENETVYTTYCPLTAEEDKSSKSAEAEATSSASIAASTVHAISKTTVTITSCSDNKCTEVPVETGVTTVTENDTVYTTYCPLTAEEDKKSKTAAAEASTSKAPVASTAHVINKTTITITSCSDNVCTESAVETGLTTVTEQNTIYTTYCPISTANKASTSTAKSSDAAAMTSGKSSNAAEASTSQSTKAPVTTAASQKSASASTIITKSASSSAKPSTAASVITSGNAANGLAVTGFAAALAAGLSFIL